VGLSGEQRRLTGAADNLRRVEVRLSDFEMDDVFAGVLELLSGFEHLHDDEGTNVLGAAGDQGSNPRLQDSGTG
jgi:hypothetical protein